LAKVESCRFHAHPSDETVKHTLYYTEQLVTIVFWCRRHGFR
jgi:hypothetical protein